MYISTAEKFKEPFDAFDHEADTLVATFCKHTIDMDSHYKRGQRFGFWFWGTFHVMNFQYKNVYQQYFFAFSPLSTYIFCQFL